MMKTRDRWSDRWRDGGERRRRLAIMIGQRRRRAAQGNGARAAKVRTRAVEQVPRTDWMARTARRLFHSRSRRAAPALRTTQARVDSLFSPTMKTSRKSRFRSSTTPLPSRTNRSRSHSARRAPARSARIRASLSLSKTLRNQRVAVAAVRSIFCFRAQAIPGL